MKPIIAKNSRELGNVLGLTKEETAVMKYRTDLVRIVSHAIKASGMTHDQIAERAKTSRPKITNVAQLNIQSISSDLLIRILAATGYSAKIKRVRLSRHYKMAA